MATKTTKKSSKKRMTAEEHAAKILAPLEEMLERGDLPPWAKPWNISSKRGGYVQMGAGDRPYNGGNVLITEIAAMVRGYQCRRWWTYKKINEAGYKITGGKGCGVSVIYWNKWTRTVEDPATGEEKNVGGMTLSHYTVFNLDATDAPDEVKYKGMSETPEPEIEPMPEEQVFDEIIGAWSKRPKILRHGDAAYYTPALDTVTMPPSDSFRTPAHRCKTEAHEHGHATGHADRLARRGVMEATRFGSIRYGLEEIVAETCASVLMGAAGFDDVLMEDSAAYCQHWLQVIRADRVAFIRMAAHGVKAAQHILGEEVTYDAPSEKATEEMVAA